VYARFLFSAPSGLQSAAARKHERCQKDMISSLKNDEIKTELAREAGFDVFVGGGKKNLVVHSSMGCSWCKGA